MQASHVLKPHKSQLDFVSFDLLWGQNEFLRRRLIFRIIEADVGLVNKQLYCFGCLRRADNRKDRDCFQLNGILKRYRYEELRINIRFKVGVASRTLFRSENRRQRMFFGFIKAVESLRCDLFQERFRYFTCSCLRFGAGAGGRRGRGRSPRVPRDQLAELRGRGASQLCTLNL